MKKMIMLLVLVAGAGYYLHWYTFSTKTEGNIEQVHIVIDKEKIKEDEQKAMEKLRAAPAPDSTASRSASSGLSR